MQFDITYKQLIAELFNTKQKAEWSFYEGGFNTILEGPNNITYMLALAPFWELVLPPEIFNIKELSPENWKTLEHGTWHVEFGDDQSEELTEITGEQGSSASKVFSIIGHALIDKVKAEPTIFKNLVFSGKESSRRNLYTRLAPILAKKLNKNLVVSADKEWYFILSKS